LVTATRSVEMLLGTGFLSSAATTCSPWAAMPYDFRPDADERAVERDDEVVARGPIRPRKSGLARSWSAGRFGRFASSLVQLTDDA
jgi:hypothetical protein